MFRRKLIALEYQQPESFDINDESQLRLMVVWLEDQKIRHYKIEDRAALRNVKSSDWTKAFEDYLHELGCPYQSSERVSVVEWMLGYATRLEYGDNVEKYKAVTQSTLSQNSQSVGVSNNPLDSLDFNDADFKAGVASLSMLLQVPPHTDYLEQLKAICLVVQDRLSKELLKEKESSSLSEGEFLPLDKVDLGFDTGDYIINEAAKILRLIHIRDLRDLQTQINSAIVKVQALIANPKTDSRLGKVGR